MKERLRSIELAPTPVEAFAKTFVARWDRYPLQLPDGTYAQIPKPLTFTLLFKHLTEYHAGRKPLTIGTYALNEHSLAQWLCLDADDEERWQGLRHLARSLYDQQLTPYLELSRRGGHLWLFTPLLPGATVRRLGKFLLATHHLSKVEIYPKQDTLTEDGPGSFMRLPLGYHHKGQRVYPFIALDGQPVAPTIRDQIALLGNPTRVPLDYIERVLEQAPPEPQSYHFPTPHFRKRKAKRGEPLSESIKHAISVLEFVSRFVELDEQHKGYCPFHDDQVKSFQVNTDHNYWHCYAGCGGGSIIDFWMKWREAHGQDSNFAATISELRIMLLK